MDFRHRIVFLIDVSLASCEKCDHRNEILISILRLLSLFTGSRYRRKGKALEEKSKRKSKSTCKSDTADNGLQHLNWGFKFFSTNSTLPRTKADKRNNYGDVNNGIIEHLEKRVMQMLDPSLTSTTKRKSMAHPSEYLMTAFTEILHEFEWHDQDTEFRKSSVRLSSHSQKVYESDETVRHLFLFARIPTSKQCLRKFSNKVVLDCDVFLDSIMSPTLLAEYTQKLKIDVSWIDMTSSDCSSSTVTVQNTYHQSISIVKEAMEKLGGALIHKDYFIQHIHNFSDLVNPNVKADCFQSLSCTNLFPTESMLPSLLSSARHATDNVVETSCTLTLSDSCAVTSIKLLPLEERKKLVTEKGYRARKCQKKKDNSAGSVDAYLTQKTCDIDLTAAEFTLIGFVSSSAVSKTVSAIDILASYMVNCDNNLLLSSLLQHLLSGLSFGILKANISSLNGKSMFALMSASSGDIGFISILSSIAGQKLDYNRFQQGDKEENTKSEPANYDFLLSKISHHFQQIMQEENCLSMIAKQPEAVSCKVSEIYNSHALNSWHVPGSSSHISALITKLDNSLKDKALTTEREILKDLKKRYLKEKQPYQLPIPPPASTSTPVNMNMAQSKVDGSGGSDSDRRSSLDRSHRRSGSLTRGRMMVDKARSASLSFFDDSEGSISSKQGNMSRRASDSFGFADLDLKTEDCLAEYLSKQYNQVLGAGIAMEAAIQSMMTVACHFMSNKEMNNPQIRESSKLELLHFPSLQREAVSFIRKHLAVESAKLKEKFDSSKSEFKKGQKATEYKLQVILLLEMESFLPESDRSNQDKIVKELISMLRPLSFACGITELRTFLESLSTSYSRTLPQLLIEVHDELDQPYPADLATFASPLAPSSVWGRPMSVMSDDTVFSGPGSSQPPSNQMSQQAKRSGRLKQHPSFADFGQKKQILVNKPETKSKSKEDVKKNAKDKGKQRIRSYKSKHAADYVQTKRNEGYDKSKVTPRKRKEKHQLTPRRKKEKSKLLVPGTPAHKQTSERILRRQQKLREHYNIKPEVQVVAESPVKDDGKHGDNRPADFIVRRSFYSSNTGQSRNLAKSLKQSMNESSQGLFHRSKSQGSLASAVRGESPMLSPRSRLIKSFCTSPSSGEKSDGTPRSYHLRRSPRKSVKRLIFTESAKDSTNSHAKMETISPHLIFDGENASDIQLASHGNKIIPATIEGFKTPEKIRPSTREVDVRDAISMPPFSLQKKSNHESDELNFKNAFTRQDSLSSQTNPLFASTSSCNVISSPIHPKNPDAQHLFSSPDQAAKLRSSFLLSPKKKSPSKLNLSYVDESRKHENCPMKEPSITISKLSPTKGRCSRSSVKENHPSLYLDNRETQDILSTPKKASQTAKGIQYTPSKVTFSSELCLSSPSKITTNPSSAQKLTPKKSILKSSPAFKMSQIKLAEHAGALSSPNKNQDTHLIMNNEKLISPHTKRKHENFPEAKEISYLSVKGHDNRSKIGVLSNVSGIKRRILSFDVTASSSSNESSNHVPSSTTATTVVTVPSPSPTKKCKTPELNKWMRKKRHSESRKSSSSSSSPSLFSPSSSSNESKNKSSVSLDAKNPICEINPNESYINSQPKSSTSTASICGSGDYICTEGKGLKRNLFSAEGTQCFSELSTKGYEITESTVSSSGHKVKKASLKEKSYQAGKNRLSASLSGGFDPKIESSFISKEELLPSNSPKNTFKSKIPSQSDMESEKSSHMVPYAYSTSKRLTRQTSSFAEGSQGFQVSPSSPSCSGHDEKRSSNINSMFLQGSLSPDVKSSEAAENQQPIFDSSPSQSTVKKTPTKIHFSPALSSSGLLQLIRSPLLGANSRKTEVELGQGKGKRKSRKHLDLT